MESYKKPTISATKQEERILFLLFPVPKFQTIQQKTLEIPPKKGSSLCQISIRFFSFDFPKIHSSWFLIRFLWISQRLKADSRKIGPFAEFLGLHGDSFRDFHNRLQSLVCGLFLSIPFVWLWLEIEFDEENIFLWVCLCKRGRSLMI